MIQSCFIEMKMKDCIDGFIDSWEKYDGYHDREIDTWYKRFHEAGYLKVKIPEYRKCMADIHNWCRENIGDIHYASTGLTFWFENEEDAIIFKLKWS